MKVGVYAGSFDPITRGHKDIIKRSLKVVDRLIILVGDNPNKKYWFSIEERKEMISLLFGEEYKDRIEIAHHKGLLVDFMRERGVSLIIRGLRAVSDYEYEMGYAFANKDLAKGAVETVFIPASREYMYLSSSGVREIAVNDGDISFYVEKVLEDMIKKRAKELVK